MTGVEEPKLNRYERYLLRLGQAKTPEQMERVLVRGQWEVGDKCVFPSGSSPSGRRGGKISSCGPVRAQISFTFYNGRESTRSVPYSKLTRF